jgi:hypothetical protein
VALCVVAGGGCIMVEVLTETTLQRSLDDAVFARAYGIALPASLGGIVVGALTAGVLLSALGLSGAIVGVGIAVAAYAVLVVARTTPRPGGRSQTSLNALTPSRVDDLPSLAA